jgi:dTDP-4-amino-4,6-dideoxygalactose transaminase
MLQQRDGACCPVQNVLIWLEQPFGSGLAKTLGTGLQTPSRLGAILFACHLNVFPDTFLLDLDDVGKKLSTRTKAIIPVDFTGQPIAMRRFQAFCKTHGLVMIQDAAHSFGASYEGDEVGSIADMTMFSFHPVKPVTTGEGGVIVTNNAQYYEKLIQFRSHGITRDPKLLIHQDEGPWYYEMQQLGYNYRMTDLQAALGKSQMRKLDHYVRLRQQIALQYNLNLVTLEREGLLKRPILDTLASSGWHLYIIQIHLEHVKVGRNEIFKALRAENIGVNVHYMPVYLQPYYQNLGYTRGLCPHSESLYETFITIPLFPKMTLEDISDVSAALHKVITYYKR